MIHLHEGNFRISITSLSEVKTNSIFIELEVDEHGMEQLFPFIDHETFKSAGKPVELLENETTLKSLRAVPKSFIDNLESALEQFQIYIQEEFGQTISFFNLVYERTGLIYQLRYKMEHDMEINPLKLKTKTKKNFDAPDAQLSKPQMKTKIELWCVKDQPEDKKITIQCQTLYTLKLKKDEAERICRKTELHYKDIWTYFGLHKKDLTRTQLHLIAHLYLKTCFIFLPTLEKNDDTDDSDAEEKCYIKTKTINCIAFVRKIVTVKTHKVPVTLELIGIEGKQYLGIKVTMFDPSTVSESGFFLTVDQGSWERSQQEKDNIKITLHTKQDLSLEHSLLPNYLKSIGGDQIFKMMQIMSRDAVRKMTSIGHEIIGDTSRSELQENAPGTVSAKSTMLDDYCLYWNGAHGTTSVDFFDKQRFKASNLV